MVDNCLENSLLQGVASCLLCQAPIAWHEDFCLPCKQGLREDCQRCPRCAAVLPTSTPKGVPCGACQKQPPAFQSTQALFTYAFPVNALVQALKYDGQLHLARVMGKLLAQHLSPGVSGDISQGVDFVTPVPLHRSRLQQRGYNQSLELARPLVRALGLRLEPAAIHRVRATAPQAELPMKARRQNVRNAFEVNADKVRGKHIGLLDDVMTTGFTVNEIARCLHKAGAASIKVWVLARA
ncbi:MAG: DNA utilization protein GntX [Gammaproteobacteria bacterium]|nr:MAG: DNA utilization protein GntX [Gammaproteobacteria bacterium]